MDITPLVPKERLAITGYGGGEFSLNGAKTSGSIFLQGPNVSAWDEGIDYASLEPFLNGLTIDLLLIGCGANPIPLLPELRAQLKARGIAVEMMDTGAACRTYNVLMSEDRRVAAALVAV